MATLDNSTQSPVRFALIGCGRVGEQHLRAIDALDDAELVAVCDTASTAAAEVGERFDVPDFHSLETLVGEVDFEVGVLATPTGLHAEQAMRLADHGRHVMTEKPMANRWADAVEMLQAFERRDLHLFVVKQLRYNPTLQLVRRALTRGWLGDVHMVSMNVFWTRPQAYFDQDAWRGTRALDGGAFLNQTSHYFDLLTWLFGSVTDVSGRVATRARDIEVEDSGAVHLRWESGALGAVAVTLLTYPKNLEATMTVAAERGTVKLAGNACDQIAAWRVENSPVDPEEIVRVNRETAEFYGDGHIRYYENVIDVLRGSSNPHTNGREGLKSLELITAAYASSLRGSRVDLPLPDDFDLDHEPS
ncbi:MAG: Gfo/Idh/MocA family protein [Myxococcota bacterium]